MGALNSPFVSHREELQTRLIAGDLKGRDSIPTAQVGEIKTGVCGVGGGRHGAFGKRFGERV